VLFALSADLDVPCSALDALLSVPREKTVVRVAQVQAGSEPVALAQISSGPVALVQVASEPVVLRQVLSEPFAAGQRRERHACVRTAGG
jgi:hypothetical protein